MALGDHHAGASDARGHDDAVASSLQAAIAQFDEAGAMLHASCARHRLGELISGDEGQAAIGRARTWMEGQGIVDIGRMIAMWTPGFDEVPPQ